MITVNRIIDDIEFLCLFDPEFVRDWEYADIGIDFVLNECDKLGDISAKEYLTKYLYSTFNKRIKLTLEQKCILRHV